MTKREAKISAEKKIKEAARIIFQEKGYAGTKTRDIAEKAGINLALMNYYFKSKENLFAIVMEESLKLFFQSLTEVVFNRETTLKEKLTLVADKYISVLQANPDLPTFIFSEIRNHPDQFLDTFNIRSIIAESHFIEQINEQIQGGSMKPIHPFHLLMNLIGMIVFPYAAAPAIQRMTQLNDDEFKNFMEERRALIPIWIESILGLQKQD